MDLEIQISDESGQLASVIHPVSLRLQAAVQMDLDVACPLFVSMLKNNAVDACVMFVGLLNICCLFIPRFQSSIRHCVPLK